MAYKKAESNSFAEYQTNEGFGSAVTGQIADVARFAQKNLNKLPAGLQGLAGYEAYPDYLQEMENDLTIGLGSHIPGHLGTRELAKLVQRNKYDIGMSGSEGMLGELHENGNGFAGFGNVDDDAFAGYETMGGDSVEISRIARDSGVDDDDDDDDDDDNFDGYGGLGDTPLESFHTYFHKAVKANTETGVINALAKAVSVVADDTPMSVKKDYYDLAINMLKRRKSTNMRYLDLQRAEIEANLGWLINPSLPKTGGFGAMLKKAVGAVGAKLGKGEKDQIKAEQDMALGKKLLSDIQKSSGLGSFDAFGAGPTVKYMGFAAAGLVIVGIVWWYCNKQKTAALATKKKRRRRKSK